MVHQQLTAGSLEAINHLQRQLLETVTDFLVGGANKVRPHQGQRLNSAQVAGDAVVSAAIADELIPL